MLTIRFPWGGFFPPRQDQERRVHFQTFAKEQRGAMLDVPLALNVSLGHQPTKSCSGLGPLISQRRTYGGRSRNVDDVA